MDDRFTAPVQIRRSQQVPPPPSGVALRGATATGEALLEGDEPQHPWTLANHHRTQTSHSNREGGGNKERGAEVNEWTEEKPGGCYRKRLEPALLSRLDLGSRTRVRYREESISAEEKRDRRDGGERES